MNLKKRLILEAEKKNVMEKTVQFNPKKKKKSLRYYLKIIISFVKSFVLFCFCVCMLQLYQEKRLQNHVPGIILLIMLKSLL